MSVYQVCERALGLLRGNRLILSTTQREQLEQLDYLGLIESGASGEAISCARHFAGVRDRLLMAHPWVCARTSTMPALLDWVQAGWRFTYQTPEDCLTILAMTTQKPTSEYRETIERWEHEGKYISCLYPIAELKYTKRLVNTEQWSPLFETAFCYSLAAEISIQVTGDMSMYQGLEQIALMRIEDAKRMGEIKKPLVFPTETYGFHKFSDMSDPRYGDWEW